MKFFTSSLIAGSAALALAACSGATEEAEEPAAAPEVAEVAETAEVEAPDTAEPNPGDDGAGVIPENESEEGTSNPIGPMAAPDEQ